ncbi:MAG: MBL fold metallo-hydrolase [Chloroflexi bacterium]|nr:MBL fold metallo-hydrolase [Chloroflexota bacterium]
MGQPEEIAPNLWTYEAAAAGMSVRGAVVVGERQAVVWDTLAHPRDIRPLAAILGEKPFHVVYSHADWDHCWGTSGFMRPPLNIIGHEACRRRFDEDVPQTLSGMQIADPIEWDAVRLAPPNMTFNLRMYLDLGGVTLALHHLPGHTSDSIVGWIPEWGVLLGGDAIETPLPVVNCGARLGGWLAALRGWASRPELKRSIPAHGSMTRRKALDDTIAYLSALSGDQDFGLPNRLTKFYRETHRKNLQQVAATLNRNE